MANIRDRNRDWYIYQERKYKKRTLKSIADELGLNQERIRQVYVRTDWEINRLYADHHKNDTEEQKISNMKHYRVIIGVDTPEAQRKREEAYRRKVGLIEN